MWFYKHFVLWEKIMSFIRLNLREHSQRQTVFLGLQWWFVHVQHVGVTLVLVWFIPPVHKQGVLAFIMEVLGANKGKDNYSKKIF